MTESRAPPIITKMQSEAAGASIEAVAGHSEDLAKIFNEGDFTKQHIFKVDEIQPSVGRCHLGLR